MASWTVAELQRCNWQFKLLVQLTKKKIMKKMKSLNWWNFIEMRSLSVMLTALAYGSTPPLERLVFQCEGLHCRGRWGRVDQLPGTSGRFLECSIWEGAIWSSGVRVCLAATRETTRIFLRVPVAWRRTSLWHNLHRVERFFFFLWNCPASSKLCRGHPTIQSSAPHRFRRFRNRPVSEFVEIARFFSLKQIMQMS